MSLKGIVKRVVGAVARSKTGSTPARNRPVKRHQSTEAQAVKSVARAAKKKL
ncbi:hypothetical protein [Litorisediminicola beolgyonensis]|uniref:CsbD-like protein n=1 Tax=Litorisediminicola beolgyonensis TaxID=1173614 RepID=A0ABW3ZMC7_9RHOB